VPLFDNSAARSLGIKFRSHEQTMTDMAEKLIELGMVKKPEAAKVE
jgi:hypothetical protein